MTNPEITPAERELLDEARDIAGRSQAPAREKAGAFVLTRDGRRFPGITIRLDTAAGLSVCAEQVALCAAKAGSAAAIEKVILWIPAAAGAHPCGQCLQIWIELAPGARFLLQRGDDEPQLLDLQQLMPDPFRQFERPS